MHPLLQVGQVLVYQKPDTNHLKIV